MNTEMMQLRLQIKMSMFHCSLDITDQQIYSKKMI